MTTAITNTQDKGEVFESVLLGGDLSKLNPEQRVQYYLRVCSSIGLNPLTRPFDYIQLNGKLTLYAKKDAADQLRQVNGISIDKPDIQYVDDWIIVTVSARNAQGRTDSDIGVVSRKDMRGDFGNALMKAVTKAKRRVTLSICGLGMLDETEIETIPDARPVIVAETGEIVDAKAAPVEQPIVTMALETAMAVTGQDGKAYGDCTSDELSAKSFGILAGLKKNGLTPEKKEAYQFKLDAIKTILAARAESK